MALCCPRCKTVDLEEIELSDVLIDRCARCAGLWFDNAELGEITGMRTKLRPLESLIPDNTLGDDSIPCPRCDGVHLRRVVFEGESCSNVLLRCASCMGTWMDRGELRAQEDQNLIEALKQYAKALP